MEKCVYVCVSVCRMVIMTNIIYINSTDIYCHATANLAIIANFNFELI